MPKLDFAREHGAPTDLWLNLLRITSMPPERPQRLSERLYERTVLDMRVKPIVEYKTFC